MSRSLVGYDSARVPGFDTLEVSDLANWLLRNCDSRYVFCDGDKLISKKVAASALFGAPHGGVKTYGDTDMLDKTISSAGWKQRSPILMHNGAIVDGWRRVQSLRRLGMDSALVEVRPGGAAESKAVVTGLPRASCWDCVLKHLGQAAVLADESLLGYDWHKVLAWGHMAEASVECPDLALGHAIRAARLLWQSVDQMPAFEALIVAALEGRDGQG